MHSGDRPKNMEQWMRQIEAQQQQLDQRLRGLGMLYAAGSQAITTDASGEASFLYGTTFPAIPVVVAVGGNDEQVTVVARSTTGFTARFRDTGGSLIASAVVLCRWQALPATT